MKIVTFTVRGTPDRVEAEIRRQLAIYESVDYDQDVKQTFAGVKVTLRMRDVE